MCCYSTKYIRWLKSFIFIGLLFYCNKAYNQNITKSDSLIKVFPGTYVQIRDSVSFFINDTILRVPSSLISTHSSKEDKNLIFYDSLKIRASKKSFTKKLYDLVIVSPPSIETKHITAASDENYINYSGLRIKNIEIIRMDVFGTNIINPTVTSNKYADNILNRTHVNTNEKIIRKNILFSVGDTISPLTISDNERLLRELSFINDARIIIVPVSEDEADILVITKDVYSLGGNYDYKGLKRGSLSVFEKNILGIGHELGLEMPFDSKYPDSPGIGGHYRIDNIAKSFINLNVFYLNGLGKNTYGFHLDRKFVSSATKYAGGISIRQMYTTVDLDTLEVPEPLKYNLQDYWISRSFLIDKESVSRIIIGVRYKNNNVFDKPNIMPESYYYLQNYKIFLASASFSRQKYYKTNLIYSYGRTEDIPYGGLFTLTAGREFNEFKIRTYLGAEISAGRSFKSLGYFQASASLASFINGRQKEQGILELKLNYFSNLLPLGRYRIRNFANVNYSTGFGRYSDEYLRFVETNGFTGFSNDSIRGSQRISLGLESVFFNPANFYGFKVALYGFTDFSFITGSNDLSRNRFFLTSIGLGLRIRNDNLLFNTLQVRLAFFPNPPLYSKINNLTISGEQLLKPKNFDPGPPSIIPYR